jgi:multidrug efflux pump subunit AcrA (membrane-fusion protein)
MKKMTLKLMPVLCLTLAGGSLSLAAIPAPVAPTAVSVFTETAKTQAIYNVLTFPARVESRVNAIVRSESEGAVTKVVKPLGSRVRRGETVAVIKHTDPVYEFAPMNVVASVSGVVNEVHITPGSLVQKGDSIVTVTDPAQLRVIIEVAALDLRAIHAGLKGELTIPGMNDALTAEVAGVSPSVDPMLGTAGCELHVSAADQNKIYSGMVGRVQFKVNQRQGYLIPDSALVYRGDSTFLRLVRAGKSVKIPVKLGERRQGQVEVLTGLTAGDVIINRASRFVADGAEVKVESATHE